MTYRQMVERLTAAGIPDAGYDAGLMLSRIVGVEAHTLPYRRDEDFDSPALAGALARREAREPLQYILGSWEFYGLEFRLNSDCLIPRADSEILVDTARERLPRGAHFCDAGCGSGDVTVALLKVRRDLTALALDISPGALCATRENAAAHGVEGRLETVMCDMLLPGFADGHGAFDAIISNPPYIPTDDIGALAPELSYEPRRALDGGRDGYDFYRAIVINGACALRCGGFFLFEVGAGMAGCVSDIGRANGLETETFHDLAGIPRAVLLSRAE